jgi:16S rRNA (adenine1518-N6/adenine1519-N6)-dimethyltransferase
LLRKALGQHHLIRESACRPAVEFLAPADRLVVEIGSGGGVLTRALLAAAPRAVWAVELDPSWALGTAAALRPAQLVVADALAPPWQRLPEGSLVAGNLPYNVGTVILERLLLQPGWERAAFLLQLEVVQRLTARPGTKSYSALSVLVAARAEAHLLGRVAPGSFRPPPKVDSAFVGLVPRPVDPAALDPAFERLVKAAFQQRRKTLANALRGELSRERATHILRDAGIDPGARAEQVPLDGWLALVASVRSASHPSEPAQPRASALAATDTLA